MLHRKTSRNKPAGGRQGAEKAVQASLGGSILGLIPSQGREGKRPRNKARLPPGRNESRASGTLFSMTP